MALPWRSFRVVRRGTWWILRASVCMFVVSGAIIFWISGSDGRSGDQDAMMDLEALIEASSNSSVISPLSEGHMEHADDVIIYNRVPKCASTSTRMVLSVVGKQNHLHVHPSTIYAQEYLNETGQLAFIKSLQAKEKPLLFIRHLFFVDFTKFGLKQPYYINMIRDPLDRLVSDYYFKRYNLAKMFPMDKDIREMTYNECVQRNYTECVGDSPKGYFRVIPYFCGMDKKCTDPLEHGQWALAQAKRNVLQHFHVVGIVDHLAKFLEFLERTLPQYFTGASSLYSHGGAKFKSFAKTAKKDPIEQRTKDIMKEKLAYDYEFYKFVKQRFKEQYTQLISRE